jgi:hypothetical protein
MTTSTALSNYHHAITELLAAATDLEILGARMVAEDRPARIASIDELVQMEGALCAAARRLVKAEKEHCQEVCTERGLIAGPGTRQ